MDEKLSDFFRSEKKSLESEFNVFHSCPNSLLLEKLAAIEARTRRVKGLSPVKLDSNLAKKVTKAAPAENRTEEGEAEKLVSSSLGSRGVTVHEIADIKKDAVKLSCKEGIDAKCEDVKVEDDEDKGD
ncbi:hypothetical protein U1Q18_017842 [Sarracenia purpurea var. burkii]